MPQTPEKQRAAHQRRRDQRLAQGLCLRCGRTPTAKFLVCLGCRTKDARRAKFRGDQVRSWSLDEDPIETSPSYANRIRLQMLLHLAHLHRTSETQEFLGRIVELKRQLEDNANEALRHKRKTPPTE